MNLMHYIKKYAWIYILGFTVMGVGIALDMYNPVITGRIIDEVIKDGNTAIFKTLALYLVGITMGRMVMGYAKEMLFDFVGVQIVTDLRQRIFDHIQSLSYNFFDSKNTGELMTRIKEDAEKIWHAISFGIMLVVEMLISLIVATILMFRISPILSIIAFVALPLLGYLAVKLENTIGSTYEAISEQNAELNSTAQENIAGVRLVKAFAREKHEVQKFLARNQEYYALNYRQAQIWGRFYPKIEFITNILPILVISAGGALVMGAFGTEAITIGTLVKFSSYIYIVISPMRMMGWLSNMMAEARASYKRINTLFEYESEIKNAEDAIAPARIKGRIEFENVSLNIEGQEVLKDINITVEPGKTLAVMGATGSGKSSLINILTRFHEHSTGQVRIDDTAIEGYDIKNLRSHISVVMQEVFLFSDTIEENILFATDRMESEKYLLDSAKNAQAHEFVSRMEESYDTIIGEKGLGLSGGQKQRISIARALAKKAEILVLDDSTSALDMETEYQIQQAVEQMEACTKVIIAHRISAVKNADEIILLEKGQIVERGTHESLIRQKGRYYNTYREQYEGFDAVS